MSVEAEVKVYPRTRMTSSEFALTLEKCMTAHSGVMYGCRLSAQSVSEIGITAGWVLMRGRVVCIENGTLSVSVEDVLNNGGTIISSNDGSGNAYTAWNKVVAHINLDDEDNPVEIRALTSDSEMSGSPEATDFNVTGGHSWCLLGEYRFKQTGGNWVATEVRTVDPLVPAYENARTIYTRTSAPSSNSIGNNGDIWFVYSS